MTVREFIENEVTKENITRVEIYKKNIFIASASKLENVLKDFGNHLLVASNQGTDTLKLTIGKEVKANKYTPIEAKLKLE